LEKKTWVFRAKCCRNNQKGEGGDHISVMKGGLKELILLRAMWKKGTTAAAHQNEFVHDHKVCKKVYSAGYA
jgi:hypothetical protein